ncbi:GspH/FimT family pseudopilin [Solimonas sp. SE-A11]|uniref:GspH/FimT family pseudopilin n=1 Tax=Solimonas sp. SE-A11 TaxID=3054954 RepID=UPI00259CFC3F|nr:GspH/FimT family pseudopilin [Solimonas sp. SE-A11]MDM4770839.1 GspH/FimT family pseudopilin [Solimonas sp. SE-A11]
MKRGSVATRSTIRMPGVAGGRSRARLSAVLRSRDRGFNLLEAMIVVSIVSILAVIGVPSFRDMSASRAVRSHVDDLAGAIRLARTEALKRGVPVTLCRTGDANAASPSCAAGTDWSSGWLMFVDRNPRGTVDANDTLIQVQQASSNTDGIIRTGTATITFIPAGIAPGADGNFLIRPKVNASSSRYTTLSRRICVTNSGATRLVNGTGAC